MHRPFLRVLALAALALPAPAGAVINDCTSGCEVVTDAPDGSPVEDPGWINVARAGQLTGVYLKNGWILTAEHVDPNFFVIDGAYYYPIPGAAVQLVDPKTHMPADLELIRIEDPPTHLPEVVLSSKPAEVDELVVMIGRGFERGAEWDYFDPPDCGHERDGWFWGSSKSIRWGTNVVSTANLVGASQGFPIHAFRMRFDRDLPTSHEAIAADGDSGGAVFAKRGGTWELIGIMYATSVTYDPTTIGPLANPGANCGIWNWDDFGTEAAEVFTYTHQIRRIINPGVPSASPRGRGLMAALLAATGLPAAALLGRRLAR